MDVLAESLHEYDTQTNEALNMAVGRRCPKFKHIGHTMTLATRVSSVVCIKNCGFKRYHDFMAERVKMRQPTEYSNFIQRYDSRRADKKIRDASHEFKRKRKHKIEAMKREQVLEKRTDQGDYQSGIANQLSDDEEDEPKTKKKAETIKFCKWCDKATNHKTWASKHCVAHNEYQKYRASKPKPKTKPKKVRTRLKPAPLTSIHRLNSIIYEPAPASNQTCLSKKNRTKRKASTSDRTN